MENLIKKIAMVCPSTFEVDYDYDVDPRYIDVRLYDANVRIAKLVRDLMLEYCDYGIESTNIEEPHEDEVKFAFSGHNFVRIAVYVKNNIPSVIGTQIVYNRSGRIL